MCTFSLLNTATPPPSDPSPHHVLNQSEALILGSRFSAAITGMENASHADTGTGERSEEHGPRGRRVRESEVIIMGVQRLSCRQRGAGKDPRETPNTERREKST